MTAEGGIGALESLERSKNDKQNGDPDKDPPNQNISFKEKLKNVEYRRKCVRTVWLGLSFWALVSVFTFLYHME